MTLALAYDRSAGRVEPAVAVAAPDAVAERRVAALLEQDGIGVLGGETRLPGALGDARERIDVIVAWAGLADEALEAAAGADVPVVLVCGSVDGAFVNDALRRGAAAIVLERRLDSTLVPAVRAAASGQLVLPREARAFQQKPLLSTREKQVLALVVLGLANGEIAHKLHVAESTVKSHLRSSFRKLGVRSRAQACARIMDGRDGLGLGILAITTGEGEVPST